MFHDILLYVAIVETFIRSLLPSYDFMVCNGIVAVTQVAVAVNVIGIGVVYFVNNAAGFVNDPYFIFHRRSPMFSGRKVLVMTG